eukprot:14025457-Alexandrium_andersonii.AAC.1
MSASLVGSEMCIRDRCRTAGSNPPNAASPSSAWSKSPATPNHPARGPAPVSYTHLTLPTICSV